MFYFAVPTKQPGLHTGGITVVPKVLISDALHGCVQEQEMNERKEDVPRASPLPSSSHILSEKKVFFRITLLFRYYKLASGNRAGPWEMGK